IVIAGHSPSKTGVNVPMPGNPSFDSLLFRWMRRSSPRMTTGRTDPPALVGRVVLRNRGFQLLHDRIRIAAGLLYVVGPAFLQWLGRFFPFGELLVADPVHFMPLVLELLDAGMLKVCPRARDPAGPFIGAVVVDDFLLRCRHMAVGAIVEYEGEGRHIEWHLHMKFGDLVDAEQRDRTPRERHRFGHAFLQ